MTNKYSLETGQEADSIFDYLAQAAQDILKTPESASDWFVTASALIAITITLLYVVRYVKKIIG
ncbi:hypothetical protein OAD57_04285 [Porticoccaceae bacterium]|nr:hypothetical protein [Porticoccaceae bacterium]